MQSPTILERACLLSLLFIQIAALPAVVWAQTDLSVRVQKLMDSGHTKEAMPLLDSFLRSDPDNKNALLVRASALERSEQTQDALRDLNHLIELDKHSFQAYRLRACVLVELGQVHEALVDLNTAQNLASDPQEKFGLFYDRGKIWRILGENQNAYQDFSKAIAVMPTASAYMQRGSAEEELHQYAEAIKDYSAAIKHCKFGDVNLHAYYSLRAAAYRKTGDLKRAAQDEVKGKSNIDEQFGDFFAPPKQF